MAKQSGIVKLRGSLGDVTFVKTKEGYMARMKSSMTRERVMKDECFARTRENNREFGAAAKGGTLVRKAFAMMIGKGEGRMSNRLHRALMQCLQEDSAHERGGRRLNCGDLSLLKGFDFYLERSVSAVLKVPVECVVTRASGMLEIMVPGFVPVDSLAAPAGATHYRLRAGGAAVDFDEGSYTVDMTETGYLPMRDVAAAPVTLSVTVPANTTLPLIQVLGIEFFQEVNGEMCGLSGGDAVSVVGVEGRGKSE